MPSIPIDASTSIEKVQKYAKDILFQVNRSSTNMRSKMFRSSTGSNNNKNNRRSSDTNSNSNSSIRSIFKSNRRTKDVVVTSSSTTHRPKAIKQSFTLRKKGRRDSASKDEEVSTAKISSFRMKKISKSLKVTMVNIFTDQKSTTTTTTTMTITQQIMADDSSCNNSHSKTETMSDIISSGRPSHNDNHSLANPGDDVVDVEEGMKVLQLTNDYGNIEAIDETTPPHQHTIPPTTSIEDIYDGVHDGPLLGTGVSGVVRQVTHKATGEIFAAKCIDFDLIESDGLRRFREEIYIMCQIDHPNIIRLEEVYESASSVYLVMELCRGGELFERLDDQPDFRYTEESSKQLVKQMLMAVQYLHSKGIIHRDLKLENFLFLSGDDGSHQLKLIDFGLSKFYKMGQVNDEVVGTPYTVAPELIHRRYDERCDIWALGVLTYMLLCGDTPFGGCDRDGKAVDFRKLRENILHAKYQFEPQNIWEEISDEAKTFISTLLNLDPKKRPSALEAQRTPWMVEWAKKDPNTNQILKQEVVEALIAYEGFSNVKKLLYKALTYTLYPFWFYDLQAEFQKLDKDHCEVNLETLKNALTVEPEDDWSMSSSSEQSNNSIPNLCEEEIEHIFDALCLRETIQSFQRQDFFAAGLQLCHVDVANLSFAFDRIDSTHRGFITCDDIVRILMNDMTSEESIREMYSESLECFEKCGGALTLDEFLLLVTES